MGILSAAFEILVNFYFFLHAECGSSGRVLAYKFINGMVVHSGGEVKTIKFKVILSYIGNRRPAWATL